MEATLMLSPMKLDAATDALRIARAACNKDRLHRDNPELRAALDAVGGALSTSDPVAALKPAGDAQRIVNGLGQHSGPDPAASRGPPQTGGSGFTETTPTPKVAITDLVRAIEALAS